MKRRKTSEFNESPLAVNLCNTSTIVLSYEFSLFSTHFPSSMNIKITKNLKNLMRFLIVLKSIEKFHFKQLLFQFTRFASYFLIIFLQKIIIFCCFSEEIYLIFQENFPIFLHFFDFC